MIKRISTLKVTHPISYLKFLIVKILRLREEIYQDLDIMKKIKLSLALFKIIKGLPLMEEFILQRPETIEFSLEQLKEMISG